MIRAATKSVVAISLLASSFPLLAGNIGRSALLHPWQLGIVPFTICEEHIKGLTGDAAKAKLVARGCPLSLDSAKSALLSDKNAEQVRSAVAYWNGLFGGKISFVENEDAIQPGSVQFLKQAAPPCGTESPTGYNPDKPIKHVYLNPACPQPASSAANGSSGNLSPFLSPYTILHEMMHVIGIEHEQARTDGRKYLNVQYRPKPAGGPALVEYDSERFQWDAKGTPFGDYDFASVMHYPLIIPGPKENSYVLTTPTVAGILLMQSQGVSEGTVGQRVTLSPGDIATIRHLYP